MFKCSLTLQLLTFHAGFMRREDAGVAAGGGADVQMELDVLLQPEALSVVTPHEDGFAVLLLMVTGDTNVKLGNIKPAETVLHDVAFLLHPS